MTKIHYNPFLPEDSWKNKPLLEAIEAIKKKEAEKQQQKIRDAVASLNIHNKK